MFSNYKGSSRVGVDSVSLFRVGDMLPTSLHGYYPASMVLFSNPTTYPLFGILTLLSLVGHTPFSEERVSSPKLIHHNCV